MQLRFTIAVLLQIVTGCRDSAGEEGYCQWAEDIVPLDYSLGPYGGDLDFDLTPGKVLDQVTIPQRGVLTWKGGGDWVDVTPDNGSTAFSSVASYEGTSVFRRVVDAHGDPVDDGRTLACPPTLDFDMTIRFETDDGVLDEAWETTLSFYIGGHIPSAELDAVALGLPQKLQIARKPDPPVPFYDESYSMSLSYGISLLSPEEYPPTSSGRLVYLATIFEDQIGEITEVSGINRKLLEWQGIAECTEPTRRPPPG